jgi:isopentenyl-diphosphate delta-isomerase
MGKLLRAPLWITSMTGGTQRAGQLNRTFARCCARFGLGMGLGSMRPLLERPQEHWKDFNLRPLCGKEVPLLGNIGIAQLEQWASEERLQEIHQLVGELELDGLIVHVNPLQEWCQPEGDRFSRPPLATISSFAKECSYPLWVKEVGQGMGPSSLQALIEDEGIYGIEFGAYGGTNFSMVESRRSDDKSAEHKAPMHAVGHSAQSMVEAVKKVKGRKQKHFIISGGVKNALDGHYFLEQLKGEGPCAFGMGSALLRPALEGEAALEEFLGAQIELLAMARCFLKLA